MFIAPLFTIAMTKKQPECPLIDAWINKLCTYTHTHTHTHTHIMECYPAIKKNEFIPFAATWM